MGTESKSPEYVAGSEDAGQCFSVSAGKLYRNGVAVATGTIKAVKGDKLVIGLTGSVGGTTYSGFVQRSAPDAKGVCASSIQPVNGVGIAKFNIKTVAEVWPYAELNLGVFEGRALRLIYPYVSKSGKVYYVGDLNNNKILDVQDHNDAGDHADHVWLDNLFNGGQDRYDTQPNGAIYGVDDARTTIVNGYTIVNPTTSEIVALREEMNYSPPILWKFVDVDWFSNAATSTRVGLNIHHNVSITTSTIYTNLYDGYYRGLFLVQVLQKP